MNNFSRSDPTSSFATFERLRENKTTKCSQNLRISEKCITLAPEI